MRSNTFISLILLLIGTVFTAIGLVVGLVFGKPLLDKAKASEEWPQTQGEILKSELRDSRGSDGTMYAAHVAYRYALDGGEFESSRIWFGGDYSTSDRSEMLEVVRKYPMGTGVPVYYSPDNPAESVLIPGAYTSSYVLYLIGMLFLIIGGLLLLIFAIIVTRSIAGFHVENPDMRNATIDELK